MKRRIKNIFMILAVFSLLFSLVGCGNADTEDVAGEESSTSGQKVEVLKIGTTKAHSTFNPIDQGSAYGKMCYNFFVQANLLILDKNTELQPGFIQSWEINEDNTEVIFTIPANAYWHDGEKATIDDAIFSLNYMKEKGWWKNYEFESVEAIDETSFKLTLSEGKVYPLLNAIASYMAYVLPEHIWGDIEVTEAKKYAGEDAVIGCGPYKFVSYDEDAQISYYEAVDNYWGEKITIEKVEVKTYDSYDSELMALKNEDIDSIYNYCAPIPATLISAVEGEENVDIGMSDNLGNYQIVFGFNESPTDDLEFRQAVSYALDYELLAMVIGGDYGEIAGKGVIAPRNKGYDKSISLNKIDVELAKQILDNAGYVDVDGDSYRELPSGEQMDVMITPKNSTTEAELYNRIAEIIVQNLDVIGIKTSTDEESARNKDVWTEHVITNHDYEICLGKSSTGVAKYETSAYYMVPKPYSNWGSCNNEEFLVAYGALDSISNQADYEEVVQNLQNVINEEVIGIALAWDKAFFPYRTDKYEGWINYPAWGVINPDTWFNLYQK